MKKYLWLVSISVALALRPAAAGTLLGTVHAEGKPGTDQPGADEKYGDRKLKHAERINYAELRDFVVYLEGKVGDKPNPPASSVVVDTRRIAQQGATFTPHVLPIVVGTTVEWPNNDDIYHNVFSMSDARQFDLQLYKGNPPDKKVTFDKPGRVDVFCSIHANMHCIVLVLENPYFALADGRGRFAITNVPPGTYTVKAWHERLPTLAKSITIPETGEVKADFVLGVTNLPKY